MSLANKTVHGLFWVSITNILIKIINFIITIILARLLEPKEFGLFALGLIFVYFFETFRDLGIGSALIYKNEDINKSANTAFFLFPSIAIAFFLISYIIAPYASDFFREEQLGTIIRVLSLSFVIWSFGTLPSVLLDKSLEFKKQALRQIIPKLGYGIITILLALRGFGVWSLILGTLTQWIFSVIIVWSIIEWRPLYIFEKKTSYELLNYGKEVASANIILFLISIVDVTMIGRLLDTTYVGYYSIALGISGLITSQISLIIGRVMFPVYSLIQGEITYRKKIFIRTIKYVSIISIPASIGTSVIAWDLVNVVYGPKWLPAVAALQLLCFYGLSRSILATTENLYLAAGKPEIRTRLNLMQLVLMAALMYPLVILYGIMGAAIAATIPSVLIVFLTLKEAGMIIEESLSNIARSFTPGIIGSFIMALSIWIWQDFAAGLSPIMRIVSSIIIGALVFVGCLWWMNKEIFYEIKGLVTMEISNNEQ
jgi:O-antigen/teichoic acid export membrane protein